MENFLSTNAILIASSAIGYLFIMAGVTGIKISMGDFEIQAAGGHTRKILYVIIGFLFIFIPVLLEKVFSGGPVISRAIYSTIIGVFIAALFLARRRKISEKDQELNSRLEEAQARLEKETQKARPAWDLARITLEAYFNRNLTQITSIYWLSVIVLTIGFGIIVWGVSTAISVPNATMPAAIASTVGVITEFIGATFLFIYRSSIEQAVNYSKMLERINSVGMAMQILDTMPDETKPDDLKSKTKAILVELLIQQAHKNSDVG